MIPATLNVEVRTWEAEVLHNLATHRCRRSERLVAGLPLSVLSAVRLQLRSSKAIIVQQVERRAVEYSHRSSIEIDVVGLGGSRTVGHAPSFATGDNVWVSRARSQRLSGCLR